MLRRGFTADMMLRMAIKIETRNNTKIQHRIPENRDAAIAALVEADVARWGESEREAAYRAHAHRSYGLALNELANRCELADAPDPTLRAAARAALTLEDRKFLRKGGWQS